MFNSSIGDELLTIYQALKLNYYSYLPVCSLSSALEPSVTGYSSKYIHMILGLIHVHTHTHAHTHKANHPNDLLICCESYTITIQMAVMKINLL